MNDFLAYKLHRGAKVVLNKSILIFALSLTAVSLGYAAPEDRGAMGGVYALSTSGFIATGTDQDEQRLASQYGYSIGLFLGEEVLPRLFVGIHLDAHLDQFAGGELPDQSQLYAFGLEGRYRLSGSKRGLIALAGIGIGTGAFLNSGQSLTEADASGGGSIWKLGLGYEVGNENASGFTYIPKLTFQRLGPQMENKVSMNVISLGVEVLYSSGR